MDKELQEKLQAYKESLTEEERKELVERSNALEAYQSAPDAVENLEKIPVLSREDISKRLSRSSMKKKNRRCTGSLP